MKLLMISKIRVHKIIQTTQIKHKTLQMITKIIEPLIKITRQKISCYSLIQI
jgi:hypothetical protein